MKEKTYRLVTDEEWELICMIRNVRNILPDSRPRFEADVLDQLYALYEDKE